MGAMANFDLDKVAGTVGLSRRYVQELLEETGKSFTEHLAERRLQRAFAMLTDRRCLHLAIIDIAFASGFGDASHFNREYKSLFGVPPMRDVQQLRQEVSASSGQ